MLKLIMVLVWVRVTCNQAFFFFPKKKGRRTVGSQVRVRDVWFFRLLWSHCKRELPWIIWPLNPQNMRPILETLLKMQLRGRKRGKDGVKWQKYHPSRDYTRFARPFFLTPTPISFSFFLQCWAWSPYKLHSEVKPTIKRRPHPIVGHFLRGSSPSVERSGKTDHSTLPDVGSAIFRARLSSRRNIRKDLESWRLYNVFRTNQSVNRGTQRQHC